MDYSPEWDYTTGGSKIMFCIRPGIEAIEDRDFIRKFECSFGESVVPVKFIQPGVFKCKAPPHRAGFVSVNLLFNGEALNQDNETEQFEYREQVPKKKKVKRDLVREAGMRTLLHGDTGPSKVRVIERLQQVDQRAFAGMQVESHEEFCAEVVRVLASYFEQSLPVAALETSDADGVGLVHDLAVLDHAAAIEMMIEHGANVNLAVPGTNITPLVIAAARGHDSTVKALVRCGASILH